MIAAADSVARSILIVEDERIVAMDIQQTLNDLGYDAASVASSADEALACALERRPELVLMDIRINGPRDGIEAAEVLKRHFDVPVVYLTAHADESTLQRAKTTAPHGYLLKPIKAAELRSVVEVSLYRHDMERRQRERDRWFAATLESIADAVVAVGLDGRVTFMNPVAEALTGVTSAVGVGQPAADVLRLAPGQGGAAEIPVLQALRERQVVILPEGQLVNVATGEQRLIVDSAAPVVDVQSSQTLGAVMVFRDVTERQRMQDRLETIERLASLGTLAAGVAHEVNNPLTVVVANAEYVKAEFEQLRAAHTHGDDPDRDERTRQVGQALDDVSSAAGRIGQIVSDLKAFARPATPASSPVDVVRAVEWAVRATATEFRNRARLTRTLEPVPPVDADDVRVGQVLVNLLTNAAQAIEPGNAAGNEVSVATGVDDSGRVTITVRDTGSGIPPEVLPHIFEPFFTTKREGGGTGLGLAICHGIVTSLGGEITADSTVGRGTTIRVVLPAAAPASAASAPSAQPASAPATAGRVLVIDDEELLLGVMGRILSDYEVETTADARHALALIDGGRRFDVILVDVTMPLMSGIAFYQDLRIRHPALAGRVVFMSGGVFESDFEAFLDTVPNVRIGKPFRGSALREVVQQMLERDRPTGADRER